MAEINGISLKKITRFKDHEGATIAQGDVYYNGKKLGSWSQDSWGGPDIYDFNTSLLHEAVNRYKASDMVKDEFREFADLDLLLYDLLFLIDKESDYKKGIKKGYSTYVCANDGYHFAGYYTNAKDPKNEAYYKEFIADCEKQFLKDHPVTAEIFSSLDDFKIAC